MGLRRCANLELRLSVKQWAHGREGTATDHLDPCEACGHMFVGEKFCRNGRATKVIAWSGLLCRPSERQPPGSADQHRRPIRTDHSTALIAVQPPSHSVR